MPDIKRGSMWRRYGLVWMACLCWLIVLLVPPLRHHTAWSWEHAYNEPNQDYRVPGQSLPFPRTALVGELLDRFPNDEDVALYAAHQRDVVSLFHSGSNNRENFRALAELARRFPRDPRILALQLPLLRRNWWVRLDGPLNNSLYPAPRTGPTLPPENVPTKVQLQEFIALARRGQKLEPDNLYFDYQLLYGLYASYRDAEARVVLHRAARKTRFDNHKRDLVLNQIAVLKKALGSPLSPGLQLLELQRGLGFEEGFRQLPRWMMEDAIRLRARGQHNLALQIGFDAMKIGRTIRRDAYFVSQWRVGSQFEGIAMANAAYYAPGASPTNVLPPGSVPFVRWADPLPAFRTNPRGLYPYAKAQGRSDILRALERDRSEIFNSSLRTWAGTTSWTGTSPATIALIRCLERALALVLNVLPALLIAWGVSTALSRRFRDETTVPSVAKRGAFWGLALLVVALGCDWVLVVRSQAGSVLQNLASYIYPYDGWWLYLSDAGLVHSIPSWVNYGFVAILVCLALSWAGRWQRQQGRPVISLWTRIQTMFAPPEDRLARFDVGWLFGLAMRLSVWLILLATLSFYSWNVSRDTDLYSSAPLPMVVGIAASLGWQLHRGWSQPRRVATARLMFRLTTQTLCGAFVALSLIYVLLALAWLPLARQFEHNLGAALYSGEAKIVRAHVGSNAQ